MLGTRSTFDFHNICKQKEHTIGFSVCICFQVASYAKYLTLREPAHHGLPSEGRERRTEKKTKNNYQSPSSFHLPFWFGFLFEFQTNSVKSRFNARNNKLCAFKSVFHLLIFSHLAQCVHFKGAIMNFKRLVWFFHSFHPSFWGSLLSI